MQDTVAGWLAELGLDTYVEMFAGNDIDISILPSLTGEDLKDIGVSSVGHRRKLLDAIAALSAEEAPAAAKSDEQPAHSGEADRRQLTVLFCDLVGSTALSRQLDPEDLRRVMRRYQDAVSVAVGRYGGHVAKYLGDGVLVYFGWPQAQEDQAERAVRTGLDAVQAVAAIDISDIDPGQVLGARVGIATGQVVVGDLVGESGRDAEAVSGETPNLAARLQQIAEPGQVVIGETTHRLLGQAFTVADLGGTTLKGFDDPIQAWRVEAERQSESRFDAAHGHRVSPLVGRETELRLLLDRWTLARAGEGQLVFISGEAGIGKSRLMQALRDTVAQEDHYRVRYQCSPYHTNSALYPAVQQLQHSAGFLADDSDDEKLDKLEEVLRQASADVDETAPIMAHLLSLPYEDRYGAFDLTPQQIKDRTLSALIGQLTGLSVAAPVVFLIEDVHWIDPTSHELLERAFAPLRDKRVLVAVTHRPEWQPTATGHGHVTTLQLNRLGRSRGADLVRSVAGDLPEAIIERIIERTDGVPLFVEELTKSLLESGLKAADTDIPETLQSSLLARLDRLGQEAKNIAQTGAVVGRDFGHDVLAAAMAESNFDISIGLEALGRSGLVLRSGTPPDANYRFKHALVQDAAYDSMLRDVRQARHGRIAEVLAEQFPDVAQNEPELLAHHFAEAGQNVVAADYWHMAGRRSAERSANAEAVVQLEKGIEVLHRETDSLDLSQRELAMQIDAAGPLIANFGYGSPRLEDCFTRAMTLYEETGEARGIFPILYGRWIFHTVTGNVTRGQQLATEFLRAAERQNHREPVMLGHRVLGTTLLLTGKPTEAAGHLEIAASYDDLEEDRSPAFTYGQDVEAAANANLAMTRMLQGFGDQSLAAIDKAVERARKLDHPNTTGYVLTHCGILLNWLRLEDRLEETLGALQALNAEHTLPIWASSEHFLQACLRILKRDYDQAISTFDISLADYRDQFKMEYMVPGMLSWQAHACAHVGNLDRCFELIETGLAIEESSGEIWMHAEILRIKALALGMAGADDEAIVDAYADALQTARTNESKHSEIRVATDFARFLQGRDQTVEAAALLAPIYAWFTEGHDLPDLVDARTLLGELS